MNFRSYFNLILNIVLDKSKNYLIHNQLNDFWRSCNIARILFLLLKFHHKREKYLRKFHIILAFTQTVCALCIDELIWKSNVKTCKQQKDTRKFCFKIHKIYFYRKSFYIVFFSLWKIYKTLKPFPCISFFRSIFDYVCKDKNKDELADMWDMNEQKFFLILNIFRRAVCTCCFIQFQNFLWSHKIDLVLNENDVRSNSL